MATAITAGAVSFSGTPAAAEDGPLSLKTDNLSVGWDESGAVNSVVLQGKESFTDSLCGFFVTDCAKEQDYSFQAPVNGSGEKSQSGNLETAGLKMKVTYKKQGKAIRVDGEVQDTTGTDRLVRVEYLLPVSAEGMYWYNDTEDRTKVKDNASYNMVTENYLPGHKMSMYPYGAVSNGAQAIAMGVPMDPPQAFLISYENGNGKQGMSVKFDFALTDKTPKNPSKASFSFVIYAPTLPEWGFRSATQDYYDLFPEYFEVKSPGGGNWLFQHAYEELDGVEDFSFKYNETPGSYTFDQEQGVVSCQYTAPHEQWMEWPGMPKEPEPTYEQYMGRFNDLLNDTSGAMEPGFPTVTVKNAAEAMKNSAVLRADGKYFTVGWYAYGVTVCFVTNHTPDIPGWNSYKLQISNIEKAEKAAKEQGARLGGVYIDNTAGLGSYNYRQDHFTYADLPLLWDADNRLVLPSYNSMYSYVKGIRNRCDANNQLVMANMVFPERGIIPYVHMVDAPGSECGPSWGWDPYIQRLRRTMSYRKPWMLLLGHDLGAGSWGASTCPMNIKENIMKSSVAYGIFANVIGYRVPMKDYEDSRPLFRKYTPIAVMEDKLGWNPVTFAQATGNGNADCERFGNPATGAAIFTAYNTGDEEFKGAVELDAASMNVSAERAEKLLAFDLLNNKLVPLTKTEGKLSYEAGLASKDVSAIIIGTKEEIWSMLFERIKATIERGDQAAGDIPEKLEDYLDVVPSQWEDMMTHMSKVSVFKSMDAIASGNDAATLVTEMGAVLPLAKAAHKEMLNYKDLFRIDILDIYSDAYAIVSGFFGENGELGGDLTSSDTTGAGTIDGKNNAWDATTIAIVVSSGAVVLAAGGVVTGLLLSQKKKKG